MTIAKRLLFSLILFASPAYGKILSDLKQICSSHLVLGKSQMDCVYKLGDDVEVVIAGVGDPSTSVVFNKVNNAKYSVKFQISPQCVLVAKVSEVDNAFISPRTGKIYADWSPCEVDGTPGLRR